MTPIITKDFESLCDREFQLAHRQAFEGLDREIADIKEKFARTGNLKSPPMAQALVDAVLARFDKVLVVFDDAYLAKWRNPPKNISNAEHEWLNAKAESVLESEVRQVGAKCNGELWDNSLALQRFWEQAQIEARRKKVEIFEKIEILRLRGNQSDSAAPAIDSERQPSDMKLGRVGLQHQKLLFAQRVKEITREREAKLTALSYAPRGGAAQAAILKAHVECIESLARAYVESYIAAYQESGKTLEIAEAEAITGELQALADTWFAQLQSDPSVGRFLASQPADSRSVVAEARQLLILKVQQGQLAQERARSVAEQPLSYDPEMLANRILEMLAAQCNSTMTVAQLKVTLSEFSHLPDGEWLKVVRSLKIRGHASFQIPEGPLLITKLGRDYLEGHFGKDESRMTTILFLASNPTNSARLRLDKEHRSIDERLRQAEHRTFDLRSLWAVRAEDLQSALLRYKPQIVHFCGHGQQPSAIILEDQQGKSCAVQEKALRDLFKHFSNAVRCVILNACYSEAQARSISEHIDCVIGMSSGVGDEASISFASAFYQALAYGKDVVSAFELGKNQVHLENLGDHEVPKLLLKPGTKPFAITPTRSHDHALSSHVVTAPLPDVRVEVAIAVTPGQVALDVIVQNHSPVVVYMGNISLALKNGQRLLFPRDAVTGEYQMERRLEPSQKFDFIMSPLEILSQVRKEDVLCAVARDSIGREYRSSEESTKVALDNLSRGQNQAG